MRLLASFSKAEEAHLLRARLEGSGIAAYVRDEHMISVDWFYSAAIGGVKVDVEDEDFARARELLTLDGEALPPFFMSESNPDPAAVVQRQLEAYNAKDLETLLGIYAETAEVFEHPATPVAQGTAQLRERFTARFREPNLHAALLNRMVMGALVVDHERVTRTFPEGPGTVELIMIYQVEAGRIARVWSAAGPKVLEAPPP